MSRGAIILASTALIATEGAAQEIARQCWQRDWSEVEHTHSDLGEGLVGWVWSWTAEGVADDIIIADCRSGATLTARARSERMKEDIPYDRRRPAMREILRLTRPEARAFFSLEELGAALDKVRVPSELAEVTQENCACAAFYPELRGNKAPYGG